MLAELDGGAPPPPRRDTTTLGTHLTAWPDTVAHIKPATVDAYRKAARYVNSDPVGARPLQRLTPADLRALYRRLRERGLSAATVALVHAVVVRALGDALADGLIRSNPARAERVAPKLGARPEDAGMDRRPGPGIPRGRRRRPARGAVAARADYRPTPRRAARAALGRGEPIRGHTDRPPYARRHRRQGGGGHRRRPPRGAASRSTPAP